MNTIHRMVFWALIGLLLPLKIASAQDHQITPWRHNHDGAVSLNFDDGYWSQVTNAVPLLNARGLKATFFLGISGMDVPWDQWRQLAEQGYEIGSHTINHPDLTRLSDSELRYELSESQRVINQNIPSQSCITLAYPGTVSNSYVQAVASEYYIAARGGWAAEQGGSFNYYEDVDLGNYNEAKAVNFYNVASDSSLYDVPISNIDANLDHAIAYHAWYIMYLHTVPDDTYYLDYLSTVLDHIVARNLWMATFGEVAQYMRERIASTLSVLSSDTSAIQLGLTNSLDGSIYNEPLTIRSIVPFTWLKVNIAQGGSFIIVDSAVEGDDTVVYFDAVPNNGTIVLTQAQGQGTEPDFMLVASPAMQAVAPGGSTSYAVTVSPTNGFSSAVALSVSGLPSGATGSFTPNPATASSTLSVTTDPSTLAGTYTLTITGISGTLTHTATVLLTVTASVAALSGVSVSPATVLGGVSSTGMVTLDNPAPVGGAVVSLTSSNTAAAQVPATVTVLAGATAATFTATTSPVASNTVVTITALYNSVSRTATLTVTAPVASSLTLVPSSVQGGNPSTGTVTLNGPAPAGGMVVTLNSNRWAVARVPASVKVLAGATTATFPITTAAVTSRRFVTISARRGVTIRAILTVTP
jgi:peptidoglycan/xylan/chitin deacetylase (PgdA/CDA1 family)